MKEQTKTEIYQYLQNYLNQKIEHSDYVDYYEWFQLNESMTLKQIEKEIKKKRLEKLFHPDQQSYLDSEFQRVFKECSNEIKEMKNVFSNQESKARYDQKLKIQKGQEKIDDSITLKEKKYVERAVETTTYKYGFYQGYMAFLMTLQDGFSMITNENHARDLLKQVGTRKIRKIIEK